MQDAVIAQIDAPKGPDSNVKRDLV
jgi:hypothetical protein